VLTSPANHDARANEITDIYPCRTCPIQTVGLARTNLGRAAGRELLTSGDRLRVGGRGAARAEDAQGTPTQSHTSPSII